MSFLDQIPTTFYFFFILTILCVLFIRLFCIPWRKTVVAINTVNRRIQSISNDNNQIDNLDEVFGGIQVLNNIWLEYKDTLHKQTEIDSNTGFQRVSRIRLTVPSEVYFRSEIIVDTPLKADFFKHLPGILTGIGIIGTFTGLLKGLRGFHPTDTNAQASLEILLGGVSDSFIVSASAIFLAMVITFLEKIAITQLNSKVETLNQLIDGLFEAGAGEEYLSRLVKSSESSASHAALLKDALVGELKQILVELTEQQIQANHATQQYQINTQRELTEQQIAATNSLLIPLERIGNELGGERQDNGTAVQKMLSDVMAAFTQQVKDLFGNQLQDINSLQLETISALQTAVSSMENMVNKFGAAGSEGANDMAKILADAMATAEIRQQTMNDRITGLLEQISASNTQVRDSGSESITEMARILTDAMSAAEIRQQNMNEQINSLLEQIKLANIDAKNTGVEGTKDIAKLISEIMTSAEDRQQTMNTQIETLLENIKSSLESTQGKTQNKLNESLGEISSTMTTLMESLGKQSDKVTAEGEKVVGDFGTQVQTLTIGVNDAVSEMKKAVESMRNSTNDALNKMNTGADTLSGAATEFAKAGQGVAGTLDKSKEIMNQLTVASGSISTVTSGLTNVLNDYKEARDTMSDMVKNLKLILDQARREASISEDVLKRIEGATNKLINAQLEADNYLSKITEVIKTSHGEFTSGMNRSLSELNTGITKVVGDANGQFHHDLTTAVQLLKGGVSEFSEVFEEAADKVTQAANRVERR